MSWQSMLITRLTSHPARGAWIEICIIYGTIDNLSRTPQGVRGLKFASLLGQLDIWRGSHPARGAWIEMRLATITTPRISRSHPARGAWIEISSVWLRLRMVKSHPARGAWIEIRVVLHYPRQHMSHPARGAWIEISKPESAITRKWSRTPQGVRGLKSVGQRPCG